MIFVADKISIMAQWSYSMMPTANNKLEVPTSIPEEWQKANQALQAVQKPKVSSANSSPVSTPPKQSQSPVVGYQYPYGWQPQPMYGYPGFSGYPAPPNYNFYPNFPNYSNCMMNNQMYMPTMPVTQVSSSQCANNVLPNSSSLDKTEEGSSSNTVNTMPASNPPLPPPPPSPPKETNGERNFSSTSNKQAPGVECIKFTLPKKFQKTGFNFPKKNDRQGIKVQDKINSIRHQTPQFFENSREFPSISNDGSPHFSPQGTSSEEDYPESLRKYANRCFLNCKTEEEKDKVQVLLRMKVLKSQRDGTIRTKDWDAEPLPSVNNERNHNEQSAIHQIRSQTSKLPQSSPKHSHEKNRNFPYSEPRSFYYHSRSPSQSPPRKFGRKKRYSSSSDSSSDSRDSRKHMVSSRVISPTESRVTKKFNTPKNKKKRKKPKMVFTVESKFTTNEALQKRKARFDYINKKGKNTNLLFTITNPTINSPIVIDDFSEDLEWRGSDAVIGTCQDLEKPFLRLTGAVDPSTVRPEEILAKSLKLVKEHYSKNQDYNFACEQLKSIRQDLVVQCIRNSFTVEVYETHARIALEKGDKTEFNQCQSQLNSLYKETGVGNRLEFTGYHILYNIFTENNIELKNILFQLNEDDKKNEVVSHALKLTSAWFLNNYHRFFKLYLSAPKMSGFIIDWFIERIRKSALKAYIKSYRPSLPVAFIEKELAFSSNEESTSFLAKAELSYVDAATINCKDSWAVLANS